LTIFEIDDSNALDKLTNLKVSFVENQSYTMIVGNLMPVYTMIKVRYYLQVYRALHFHAYHYVDVPGTFVNRSFI
jgi:hypothetical protein